MNLLFQLILTTLLVGVESSHGALSYEFSQSLHANYSLYWNKPTADGEICMAVEVDTEGWVGLGFSPNGGMTGSDIMMAWVKDGEVTITDRYAVSESLPVMDVQQDFQLVGGYEEDGKTVIEFCRKLQTCDDNDRHLTGTTKVIYSWSDSDPISEPLQHTTRGTKSVNFIGTLKEFSSADLPADTQTVEFRMGNLVIPHDTDTTYWCKTIRFNQPATKRHIIKLGVLQDPRTASFLHHIVLYQCTETVPEVNGSCVGPAGIIETEGLAAKCQLIVISIWTVGGEDVYFPVDAGLPIGPDEQFDTVLLEVHYNNPNLVEGAVDDSGIVWMYTEQLRTHDLGIYFIGHLFTPALSIPPKADRFLTQIYCPNECTSMWPHDINVIGTILHTHYAGIALWTQLIQNGEEIGYVDMNMNYDFDYQDMMLFEEPVVLKPGDDLILNCLYRTNDREEFTLGGRSAREEMCFDFFFYYPRMDKPSCLTTYRKESAFNEALESFQCNEVYVNGSTTPEELESRARHIEWTERITNTLEITQSVNPSGTLAICGTSVYPVTIPKPGVDYEVFKYHFDLCGGYNGTYYPGGQDANYYYPCDNNEPYFDPIGPTDSAARQTFLTVMLWMSVITVLSLF